MDDALTLLRLQLEWGADEALDMQPLDRLRAALVAAPGMAAAPLRSATASGAATPRPSVVASLGTAPRLTPAEQSTALAGQADTLDGLRDALAAFDGCALRETASNLVFAEGNPRSTTIVIGEPPGRDEDRGGHPFAGADGLLLEQMLGSVGLTRAELMLTPLLPWRPPGGRPPNAAELAACLPFLHRLIALLNPRRMLLFGGSAARALLPLAQSRRRATPGWTDCRISGCPEPLAALALPSLSEMQKTRSLRRSAWAGLRLLRRSIDAEVTGT